MEEEKDKAEDNLKREELNDERIEEAEKIEDENQAQAAPSTPEEGMMAEKVQESIELTLSEEIETEWARTLHIDFNAEEARKRAEAAGVQTPPPPPGAQLPPAPQPVPERPYVTVPPASAPVTQKNAGAPGAYGHPEPMPDTYLVWSVVATVLCCLIPGIVAIVYSSQVSSKYYAKDYEGARKASERAQWWIIASIVLGVVTATVQIPMMLFL